MNDSVAMEVVKTEQHLLDVDADELFIELAKSVGRVAVAEFSPGLHNLVAKEAGRETFRRRTYFRIISAILPPTTYSMKIIKCVSEHSVPQYRTMLG